MSAEPRTQKFNYDFMGTYAIARPGVTPSRLAVLVVRVAEEAGMTIPADVESLLCMIENYDDVDLAMNILCEEAIDWLNEHRPKPGCFWGFRPETLPPADFGLWFNDEEAQ